MPRGWMSKLSPEELREWDAWVTSIDEELFPRMDSSAFVMSLVPGGKPDAKFCVELGMAIMLGKPVITLARPGDIIPHKLRLIADRVIIGDLGTAEGRSELSAVLAAVISQIREDEEGKREADDGTAEQ